MYNNFFYQNPNYCLHVSQEGDIMEVNNRALEFLDFTKDELMGKQAFIIFPGYEREKAVSFFISSRNSLKGESLDIDIVSRTGIILTVSWTVIPEHPEQKEFYFIFQNNTLLKKQKLQLDRLQAMAHIGTWEYIDNSKDLDWSDEAYRIFGQDKMTFEPTLKTFSECIFSEDRDMVLKEFTDSIEEGRMGYRIKHRVIHGITGQVRWVDEKCVHILDNEGNYQSSMGIVQDITDNELLSRQYESFFHVVESSSVPTVITDTEGNITFINESCEELYEFSEDELLGSNPSIFNPGKDVYRDLGISYEEFTEKFSGMWKRLRDPEFGYWVGELVNRTKSGTLLNVYLFINSVKDKDGKIISYVATNIDVSAEREKENKVRIETYQAIADMAEQRDNETGKHMNRIGEFSYFIASKLGHTHKFCEDLLIFAPFHDIGKVGIPDSILRAPRKLTESEFEIIKNHTVIGHDIFKNRISLEMADEIAYCHQEKFDGSGYPRGLTGQEIPISARICTIADVYDALRSERPYKRAFTEEETIDMIRTGAGSHFDPVLADLVVKYRKEMNQIFHDLSD